MSTDINVVITFRFYVATQKIQAIRAVKDGLKCGLKEAKDIYEDAERLRGRQWDRNYRLLATAEQFGRLHILLNGVIGEVLVVKRVDTEDYDRNVLPA